MADLRLLIEVLTKGQGDLKNLNRDLKRTGEEAERTGSQLGNMGKAIGAFATGFVAFKAVEFLGDATNAAAEFNDTMSATGQIIGDQALPELEKWADGAAEAFGASKQEALDAANTFAVFGKAAGLAGGDLVDFSVDLTELAGDLASFRGGTTEEAITAIGAALRGESEPIRRYGVLLDDATLRQRALRLGIIDTVKQALTPQQRVLAAQAEIFEQTTDAQGDFARTSDEMANTQRTLGAELENVNIEIGQKLIPVMLQLANFVLDVVVPAISTLADAIDVVADGIQTWRSGMDTLTGPLGDTNKNVHEINPELGKLKDRLEGAGSGADSLRTNLRELGDESERQWERIAAEPVSQMSAQADAIRDAAFQQMVEVAKGLQDGRNAPKVQMEALAQMQEENMDNTAQVAYLKGLLTDEKLADGLSDSRADVRAQAEATRLAIVNQLATLGVDAFNWGYGIASELSLGMRVGRGTVIQGAAQLGGAIRSQLGVESEPEDPNSPLHGITKWGLNIAKTLQEGMERGRSLVSSASATLASAITPGTLQGFSAPLSAVPAGGVPAVGGLTIILQNHGDPITEDDDVLESLRLLVPHIRDAVAHG